LAERYYPRDLDELAMILRHFGRRYPSTSMYIYFHLREHGVDYISNIRRGYIEFLQEYGLNMPVPSHASFRRLVNELMRKGAVEHAFWGDPPAEGLARTHYIKLSDAGRDIRHPAWWNPYRAPIVREAGGRHMIGEEERGAVEEEGGVEVVEREAVEERPMEAGVDIGELIREMESAGIGALGMTARVEGVEGGSVSGDVEAYIEKTASNIVASENTCRSAAVYASIRYVVERATGRIDQEFMVKAIRVLRRRLCRGPVKLRMVDVYAILFAPVVSEPGMEDYLGVLRLIAAYSSRSQVYKCIWDLVKAMYSAREEYKRFVDEMVRREYGEEGGLGIIENEAEYMGDDIIGVVCSGV